MITTASLRAAMPLASNSNIARFVGPLSAACARYSIATPLRQAHFFSQLAHESASLRYVRELASGAAYDTGPLAARLGNTPEDDGDGERYLGRGLIQITGRANYAACGAALRLPLLEHPEMLELPDHAAMSAGWFWSSRGLNTLADADDLVTITRRINGGLNGLDDRRQHLARARLALATAPSIA